MAESSFLPGLTVLMPGENGLAPGCCLALSKRSGGVSGTPYDTLNLSFAVGDDPTRVTMNRQRLARALGFSPDVITFAAQAHGLHIQAVGEAERGRGHSSVEDAFPNTDALLTGLPGMPLAILTADCYPVAVMGSGMIAIAHAGWRGTLGDLPGLCVAELAKTGLRQEEMSAYLGPGIRDCCYTVDEGRAAVFVEKYGESARVCRREADGFRLDLELANRLNLEAAGLRRELVYSQGDCTACNPAYFSYRREGLTGRQVMLLWMSEDAKA